MSKIWEIEIHIFYSGVSANADPERFICLNLCFIWIGDVFWDFQFQWLYPTFLIKKKLCDGWFNRWVRKHVVIPPSPPPLFKHPRRLSWWSNMFNKQVVQNLNMPIKLPMATGSKMINLNFKLWKFKADNRLQFELNN